jgi:hypothetical protein
MTARKAWFWFGLALVGATCFGTGIAVAMALPIAIFFLLPAPRAGFRPFVPLFLLLLFVPLLYVGLLRAYVAVSGSSYPVSSLFVAAIVRWNRTLELWLSLIGYASARFPFAVLDLAPAFPTATSYVGLVVFAGSILALVWRNPVARRPAAACLVLLLAVYGIIAAGRVLFFEGEVGEAFVLTQGRYHYVGLMMVSILLSLVAARIGAWLPVSSGLEVAAFCGWLGAIAAACIYAGPTIDHHDGARAEVERVLAAIRRKVEEAPAGQPVYITNRPFEALPPFFFRIDDFPGWAGVFVVFSPDNRVAGRQVYFMQRPPNVRERLRHGKRMSSLIVAPRPGMDWYEEPATERRRPPRP